MSRMDRNARSSPPLLLLGAHMSTAGGVHTALIRAVAAGCTAVQLFVKNNNQWKAKPLGEEDIRSYKREAAKASRMPAVAHAAYLINLCASDAAILKKSRLAMVDELQRCERLGVKALIVHPGSHMGSGMDAGIRRVAESLNWIHERTAGFRTKTALELTAGQGSSVGYRFEHLADIIRQVERRNRMRVCLDTCHLYAAGYDIGSIEGWNAVIGDFDRIVGLKRLCAVHVNDSKRELGSRVDRHEHIGKGRIGLDGFRALMRDPRLAGVPKILETPKSEDLHEDMENLSLLRSLLTS